MACLKLPGWKWLLFGSLLAVFLVGAACGDDATPAPVQPSGITAADVESAVKSAVGEAVGDTVSAAEIAGMVNEAVTGIDIPEGVSAEDVGMLVNEAVKGIEIPEGVSAEEIDRMVKEATEGAIAGAEAGVTSEELAMAIDKAVSDAVAQATDIQVGEILERIATPVAMGRFTAKVPEYVSRGKYGGTPSFGATSDPGFLDLHFSASINSGLVVAAPMYNGLVEYDPVNYSEIIGDLATGWEKSADGGTYRFFIHPEAKWTDGTAVTAQDVVFSLDRIVDPDAVRPRAGAALKPFYARGNARVVDEKTVDVGIKFPSAAFMSWLAFPYLKMYPAHVAGNLTQEEINCCHENMIGSGPFLFKELERGNFIEWERNPNYFKEGLPFFDGYKSFLFRDRLRMVASMKTEQLMAWTAAFQGAPTYDVFQQLEEDTGGKVKAIRLPGVSHPGLILNWTKPPLDNPNVRKAIMLVLDRVELIKAVFKGFGRQGTFLPGGASVEEAEANWPGWRYVDADGNLLTTDPVQVPGARKHPDDIAEAVRLIDEAGARGFKGTFMVFSNADAVARADLVARQLKKHFDWDLTVRPLDLAAASVERNAGRFDIHSDGHGLELKDPNALLGQMYLAGGGRNPLGWHDPRIDVLAEEQLRAPNADARKAKVLEIEAILREEGIAQWVPLGWIPVNGALNVKIRNFHLPKASDVGAAWNVIHKKEHLWFNPDAQSDWGLGE
jgi:ABC-type transport system substrate-binding protein